jgi:hypothetical protein
VIVTDRGGPAEHVMPGETGLVVPGDDRAALAGAIRTLLSDEGRRHAMGHAAREHMLNIAGRPKAHGDAILKSVDVAAPRPGWRHAADLKMALDLAQKDRLRR